MAIEGTLDELRLPEILQLVAQQRKTGILTIQGEETIVAVSFLHGRVVAADSLEETVEERLARLLVRDGIVGRGALADAAARSRDGEGRLVDVLVEEGYLSRERLLDALRAQTLDLLEDLIAWRRGEFKFYAGEQVSFEEGFEPISVEDLLIAWLDHPAFTEDEAEAIGGPAGGGGAERETSFADVAASAGREELGAAELGTGEPGAAPTAPADPAEVRRRLELTPEDGFAEPGDGELPAIDLADEVPWPGVDELARAAAEPAVGPRSFAEIELDADAEPEADDRFRPAEAGVGGAAAARRRDAAAPRAWPAALPAWVPASLAAGLAAVLLVALLTAPGRFLLPFPWQAPEREALAALQAQARDRTVDRAAKTFFLLEGRFPESLERLVALDLLEPGDVRGPSGEPLLYEAQEDSYRLGDRSEAITGNFLLDPELFGPTAASARAPLVLLD